MPGGTVWHYDPHREFGFITPEAGGQHIYFRRNSLDTSGDGQARDPQLGERVIYRIESDKTWAASWFFPAALTPAQQELVIRVIGPRTENWEIWNTREEQTENQLVEPEQFGGRFKNHNLNGTFGQVLLGIWYLMAEHGHIKSPLVRWPDMPRFSVRYKSTKGAWNPVSPAWYTQAQAQAFAAYIRAKGRHTNVQIHNLWPKAPRLSVAEAAKVLAECRRHVHKESGNGDPEVTWYDDRWGQITRVATGYFAGDVPWIDIGGRKYKDDDALSLQFCGFELAVNSS